MAEAPIDRRRHLLPQGTATPKPFTAHSTPRARTALPDRDRQAHGGALLSQLQQLKQVAASPPEPPPGVSLEGGVGLQVEFVGQPDVELALGSLSNETKKIELLNVRHEGGITYASVFVPDGKLAHFEKYITDYLEERTGANGQALDHKSLLHTIASIRQAHLEALWTDDPTLLPIDPNEAFWWEVWLPVRGSRQAIVSDFRALAHAAGCEVPEQKVDFPDRTVLLMRASRAAVTASPLLLNCAAEFRRAKDTADFFDRMGVEEQSEWVTALLAQTEFAPHGQDVPHVCLLDSGVNRGHPLLEQALDAGDLHTVNPAWGTDEIADHGTGLAGLVCFGDLTEALSATVPTRVSHRLESVKLLHQEGENTGPPEFHAALFAEAVSRPEISAPTRKRVFASAVSASDYRDRGRPSSWSAAVDRVAADVDGAGQDTRLVILSAGNTELQAWHDYPSSLSTNLIHDPGQAWNAITVGAYTAKVDTEEPGWLPVAPEGGLSPFTTTSATWDGAWPLKPDVVFEGGNAGRDATGPATMTSLSLLSTGHRPNERLFRTTNATSAASALCARMAAEIMTAYPKLRAETVRALLVHSAEWTPAMREANLPASGSPTKRDYVSLVRHCGWGVPDLEKALWSAGNSLTLVVEDQLHPYQRAGGGNVVSRDMHLHALPWPKEELQALGGTPVQLRITLSYFIEPNPSARGGTSKFHYPSHRLRFDVQRPLEASTEAFVARINAAAQSEDDGTETNPKDPGWYLGSVQRHRGSLHQDVWEGTAAELATRGFIAVYPAAGWWRTRTALERYDLAARYSLVVSIRTPETDVDLYTPVANQIAIVV